jgi:hypothetical protein
MSDATGTAHRKTVPVSSRIPIGRDDGYLPGDALGDLDELNVHTRILGFRPLWPPNPERESS